MADLGSESILELCDEWVAAVTKEDGTYEIFSEDSEQYRLSRNQVFPPHLGYESYCAACVGLAQTALLPNMISVTTDDHHHFYRWSGELLLGHANKIFSSEDDHLRRLFKITINASLAGTYLIRENAVNAEEASAMEAEIERMHRMMHSHTRQYLHESGTALTHLAFALLEGVLRRRCKHVVNLDGKVIREFKVHGRTYRPTGRQRVNSVVDLMDYYESNVADRMQRPLLARFRRHLKTLDSKSDRYDAIYVWRNSSLHGEGSHHTAGGAVLLMCVFCLLGEVKGGFRPYQELVIAENQRQNQAVADGEEVSEWLFSINKTFDDVFREESLKEET